MNDSAVKRRWFWFHLATLFVASILLGGWLSAGLTHARQREHLLEILDGVQTHMGLRGDASIPLSWRLFGATAYEWIYFASDGLSAAECEAVSEAFPEANVVPVSEQQQFQNDVRHYYESLK